MPTGLCNFVGLCKRWLVFIPNWIRNDLNTCTISYLQPPFTPLSTPFACRSSCLSIFPLPLPIHLSDRQTVCLSFCLSALPSVRPSVWQSVCLCVCLSVFPSVCLSVFLSVYPSVRLPIFLSVCLSVRLSVCLSVYLSIIYLFFCLSVRQSLCLSVSLYVFWLHVFPAVRHLSAQGLSVYPRVCMSSGLSIFLSLRLSVRLFCLSISDCLFVGLFVSPSTVSGSLPVFNFPLLLVNWSVFLSVSLFVFRVCLPICVFKFVYLHQTFRFVYHWMYSIW